MGGEIGYNCFIGFSLIQAGHVKIGNCVYIGHFNIIWRLESLCIGSGSRITFRNWISGATKGSFTLGKNSSISGFHYIDASADIKIGSNSIIAGRGTQFFSHGITPYSLDFIEPITIGDWCYIGSSARFIPGSSISDHVFVGMGSVITKKHMENYVLLAGSPAIIKKILPKDSLFFNRRFLPHAHHPLSYQGDLS